MHKVTHTYIFIQRYNYVDIKKIIYIYILIFTCFCVTHGHNGPIINVVQNKLKSLSLFVWNKQNIDPSFCEKWHNTRKPCWFRRITDHQSKPPRNAGMIQCFDYSYVPFDCCPIYDPRLSSATTPLDDTLDMLKLDLHLCSCPVQTAYESRTESWTLACVDQHTVWNWEVPGQFGPNLRALARKLNGEQNREPFVLQNWRAIPKHQHHLSQAWCGIGGHKLDFVLHSEDSPFDWGSVWKWDQYLSNARKSALISPRLPYCLGRQEKTRPNFLDASGTC